VTFAQHAALERAIAEAPHDQGAWLVYEDWLMAQGDPRSRLIELERIGDRRLIDAERERLAPLLFGPEHERLARMLEGAYWRGPFVHRFHLYTQTVESDDLLAPLFASPAARLLTELTLGSIRTTAMLSTIAAAKHLREVVLRFYFDRGAVPAVADLSQLAALEQLDSLTLDGIGAITGGHRQLRALKLSTRHAVSLDALAADLPALTSLELRCSQLAHDGRAITTWPSLSVLDLQVDRCIPDPVELFIQTGLAAQLQQLRISDGVERDLPAPPGVWPIRRDALELDDETKQTCRDGALARIAKVYLAPPLVPIKYACLCCRYPTLSEPPSGTYEICPVCFWEDDPVQADDPTYRGGANEESLDEARTSFAAIGVSDPRSIGSVRPPTPEEIRRRAPP